MKFIFAIVLLLTAGCSSIEPLKTVANVDLQRFMGDWYVVGHIPTYIEKNAYNAVESYRMAEDGSIETTFTFREGGFDGEKKTFHPRGFVEADTGNAVWGMQFVWPVKAEYRIVKLANDYSQTIIARSKRDYLWVMARDYRIDENEKESVREFISQIGYDPEQLRWVPQQWP